MVERQDVSREYPLPLPNLPLDLSVVIRCGRDGSGLRRCLQSIDANVETVISVAEDAPFLREMSAEGYKFAPHSYGNWSVAAQAGIDQATNSHVIIMDADSVFNAGAIDVIHSALDQGYLLVQPRLIFLDDGSYISTLIARTRTYENRKEPKAYSPGLGLDVERLVEKIGIGGKVYNLAVAYGDDGDLDQRRRSAGIDVYVAHDALVFHDPIKLSHEIRTAYRFGIGERQAQAFKGHCKTIDEILSEEFLSDGAKKYYIELAKEYGLDAALFMLYCRSAYVGGYVAEDRKRNGTL